MRCLIALVPLALLAACGGNEAATNGASAAPTGATAPAPPAATATPGPGPVSDAPAVLAARAEMMNECIAAAPPDLPPSPDRATLCGCVTDRKMAGYGEREAVEACAANMGVTLPPGD